MIGCCFNLDPELLLDCLHRHAHGCFMEWLAPLLLTCMGLFPDMTPIFVKLLGSISRLATGSGREQNAVFL